ncbi:MAG: hypothetical protein FWC43_13160 [Planctomycetaceae bacterium]|nr:hypothetical protein [Planctomycetaceae bacterium]
MSDWKDRKKWSDRFLPEIKRILGEHLIGEPPVEEDMLRNTDLTVLRLKEVRIACRVRTPEYYPRYANEFTIRSGYKDGVKTELPKIIEGWGDYFFYGFSDREEKRLCHWILGNLNALRLYINKRLYAGEKPWCAEMTNTDEEKTKFVVFRYKDIPDFLIAHWKGEAPCPQT